MSDASEVKRWRQWKKFDDGSIEIYPWNSSTGPDVPCFITAEDHDRIVDELKAEVARQARVIEELMEQINELTMDEIADKYELAAIEKQGEGM